MIAACEATPADVLHPVLAAACAPRWRLVGWDVEQGVSFTLERGPTAVLVELERPLPGRACAARTARFDVMARAVDRPRSLSREELAMLDRVIAALRRAEPRLASVGRPVTTQRTEVREVRADRVLVSEGCGQYYVNPYAGCIIGCPYCYVAERADFSRELAGLPRVPWGRWVAVKIDAPEVLERELARAAPGPVRLSPILTDPYQPIERRYRVTRRCLEVLARHPGFAPVVLTRAARVLEDVELLARFPHAAVGLSIPTDDDRVRQRFEPGADPIDERLEALAALAAAGVRTFAVVQPLLPMDPERLVERVAPHVRSVRIDRMHAMDRALPLYRAAGREDAASDAWFAATKSELEDAFTRRGVLFDELEDMRAVVGLEGA